MNLVDFGKFFKEQRIKSGYGSQRKLASVSGISNGTIARIEAGTQKATIETLRTISKYLTSTSYGEMLEKTGHFDGLSDEKRRQMMSHYNFRIEFTEQFRELINKMAPSGNFPKSMQKDILNFIEKGVDEDFECTPSALIELMYEKGDASDMVDLFEEIKEIAKKHGVLNDKSTSLAAISPDISDQGTCQPLPIELSSLLQESNITYNGHPLTEDDRKLILDMLNRIYPDQKDLG